MKKIIAMASMVLCSALAAMETGIGSDQTNAENPAPPQENDPAPKVPEIP